MRDFRAEALANILAWYQRNAPEEFRRLRAHLAATYGMPNASAMAGLGAANNNAEAGGGFFRSIGAGIGEALRDAAGWYLTIRQQEDLQRRARQQAENQLAIAEAGAFTEAARVRELELQREYMRQAEEIRLAQEGPMGFLARNWMWLVAGLGGLWLAVR